MSDSRNTPKFDRRAFIAVSTGALAGLAARQTFGVAHASQGRGLVVGHPEGAEAGMKILAGGGNAVDAIVAAALAAGVVAVSRCGIGGYGAHMTIGLPDGKVTCIDSNSEAPKAARADMFPVDAKGIVKGNINKHGWLAAGVPGTLAGLQLALDKYGTLPFAKVVRPAIEYARDGFAVYWPFDNNLLHDPGTAKLFTRNGKPLKKGDHFRNPDLADMLQHLAEKGSVEDFYQGAIARRIAEAFHKNGGLVTADDMASYRPHEEPPLTIDWHDHTIATAPVTAGGLTILQIIASLKALGASWSSLHAGDAVRAQMQIEAMRIAWGDRLRLFGDPRFVDVPVERLLSEKYAEQSADKVRTAVAEKRPVPVTTTESVTGGTVNLSAVDSKGMLVDLTLTHGESFGAEVTVDGLGLLLGHGMSRFDPEAGRPNSIGPGKRPLDNMSPTIVLHGGKPIVAVGAVGGRRIPNAVLEVLLKRINDGTSLVEAVTYPRLHTEGGMAIHAERGRPKAEIDYLEKIGYSIYGPQLVWVAAVEIDRTKKDRSAVGVADYVVEPTKDAMREPHPSVTRSG